MTRFMMTLDDAIDLVLHAFEHGSNGDIFVQKAPAVTIETLTQAILEMMGRPYHKINIIGTRHGEKLFEALCSREEKFVAQDEGEYYRIPVDNRDLNYAKSFAEDAQDISLIEDYNSENTRRLDVEGMKTLLRKLDFMRELEAGNLMVPECV
jgi:UDP-glucose 4-epimerase